MKKIYTLAALAVSAMAANAAVSEVAVNRLQLADIKAVEVESNCSGKTVQTRADEGWTSLGEGVYRESLIAPFMGIDPQDIPVEIEQSTEDANKYRMVNPYANWQIPWTDVTYDATGTYYIYFTLCEANGKTYWYFDADGGMPIGIIFPQLQVTQTTFVDGMLSLLPMFGNSLAGDYESDPPITPADIIAVYGESVYGSNPMPGNYNYSYSFEHPRNGTQPNILLNFESQEPTRGWLTNDAGTFTIALPGYEIKEYDPFEGLRYVGECDFFNPLISNIVMEDFPSDPIKVTVYEEPLSPGYFKIKNAWSDWNTSDVADKVVFELNAMVPGFVRIPYQETQYNDIELGDIGVCSQNWLDTRGQGAMTMDEFIAQYPDRNNVFDTTTKKITIAGAGMLYGLSKLSPENVYFPQGTPMNAWLQLPADYVPAAVKEISVDGFDANAPVEYFNIQGMRINNPAEGQLVIMKQGNKAVKVIVK